jgi:hypothetical protein
MKYFEALKEWNKGKSLYCSPKKGTKEYDEVRAIQNGGVPVPAPAPAPPPPAPVPASAPSGMKMRNTRKKVKIGVPVADRPLPTTQFSSRATPVTTFSSRGITGPVTSFSSRGKTPITNVASSGSSGVLGKEAGKMINMALKGKIARKRKAEAEKQMLFDLFLK